MPRTKKTEDQAESRTEEEKARDAELARQEAIRDAVDRANREELPNLGGDHGGFKGQ